MFIEAPDPTGFADYTACKTCQTTWKNGFVIMEGSPTPIFENQPPTSKDPDVYPTGQWVLVGREGAVESFGEEVVARGRATIDIDQFNHLFPWMHEEETGH